MFSRCGSCPPPPTSKISEWEEGEVVSEWRRNLASALEKKQKRSGGETQLITRLLRVHQDEDEDCWGRCVGAVSSSGGLVFCSGAYR